jgi:hypothetical protein
MSDYTAKAIVRGILGSTGRPMLVVQQSFEMAITQFRKVCDRF